MQQAHQGLRRGVAAQVQLGGGETLQRTRPRPTPLLVPQHLKRSFVHQAVSVTCDCHCLHAMRWCLLPTTGSPCQTCKYARPSRPCSTTGTHQPQTDCQTAESFSNLQDMQPLLLVPYCVVQSQVTNISESCSGAMQAHVLTAGRRAASKHATCIAGPGRVHDIFGLFLG